MKVGGDDPIIEDGSSIENTPVHAVRIPNQETLAVQTQNSLSPVGTPKRQSKKRVNINTQIMSSLE